MCSMGMLPKSVSHRTSLLQRCIDAEVSVHFIFEQYVVQTSSDISELNDLLSLINVMASNSNRTEMIADMLDQH